MLHLEKMKGRVNVWYIARAVQLAVLGLTLSLGCSAAQKASKASVPPQIETYKWNRVLPPQMERHADIVSIGRDALCRDVRPPTSWTSDKEVRTSDQVLAWRREVVHFSSRHEECWKQVSVPRLYALDTKTKVRTTKGYDETQRQLIQQNLTAEIAAGNATTMMAASVKAELQKTEEIIKAWKTQTEEEVEVTYPAGVWFTVWSLIETVQVNRETTTTILLGSARQVMNTIGPTSSSASIEYLKAVVQDRASQEAMRRTNPTAYGRP